MKNQPLYILSLLTMVFVISISSNVWAFDGKYVTIKGILVDVEDDLPEDKELIGMSLTDEESGHIYYISEQGRGNELLHYGEERMEIEGNRERFDDESDNKWIIVVTDYKVLEEEKEEDGN